jgi:hypothetical protein
VVPARMAAAPASSGSALRTAERTVVAENTWGKVTPGFFGPGKT